MAGLSAASVPLDVLTPPPVAMTVTTTLSSAALASTSSKAAMTPAEAAKRAAIAKTAKDFEASFISNMLKPMMDTVGASAPFSGGEGEQAFKSFLTDALAKQMAKHGGLGVTASVQREMLKMQGLT